VGVDAARGDNIWASQHYEVVMFDQVHYADALSLVKSGLDSARAAFGLWRDIRQSVPAHQQEEVSRALEQSERQLQIAEAQIAAGLGYPLCRCVFPPTIMLAVGWQEAGKNPARPVHQCPLCGGVDADWRWQPTCEVAARAREYIAAARAFEELPTLRAERSPPG
jgi:hypothetical protein